MFRGIHAINLDPKGRLAVPTRYRERLEQDREGSLILTIDTESPCLLLYPVGEWEAIEVKLEALPSFNAAARRIQRLLIGHATELMLDGAGRVLLPPLLRTYAKLEKTVIFVGQGKKFEIWDEGTWQTNRDSWLTPSTDDSELPADLKNLSL